MKRLLIAALLLAASAGVYLALQPATDPPATGAADEDRAALVARGEYLARAGNCMACHTAPGGTPWAGGRAMDTPFGTIYTSNLTPDPTTGLGQWTADDFWKALHEGRARDGRLLYPAFPYTSYTRVTRADADAIWAWLQTLPPVEQPNRPHALRFPYDTQAALLAWRALYFKPGVFVADATKPEDWNRGAYLVQGLGHCSACHAPRNALGASSDPDALAGGLMPVQNWYAPSLTSPHEAGVADWAKDDIVALLRDGVSGNATVAGPMAEVVFGSTQYLSAADLDAMAVYLKSLPVTQSVKAESTGVLDELRRERGAQLYGEHCADCHGERGEGKPGIWPALAGNRAVTMDPPANTVRIVLGGGYAPATRGNPRPYGMPPFAAALSDDEVALVVSHIRGSWGNTAAPVSSLDVQRLRGNLR
ncbi:c-type cytochrome [Methyloversatilis discipulorum]|uniref:c-type cytochrome n=1 Tax=Methyloversatilis discipulorum TaxID=1119528 RepID=UPI003F37FBD3